MEWFSGSISSAIGEAKTRGTLFVVAVHGPSDDDETKHFLSVLDAVSDRMKHDRAVAIRLENGTDLCAQFAQIYPVVLVPVIYFIDSSSGVDLEITGGDGLSEEKLLESLTKASEEIKRSRQANALSPRAARVEEAQRVLQDSAPSQGEREVPTPTSDQALEDRVARAKDLLAARRAKKTREEEEAEKSSEMQRREVGKQMAEMKRQQEDLAIRQAAEERRKDKDETRQAKERIKAQIEQDRADRAEKFNKEKEEREEKGREMERARLANASRQAEEELRNRSSIARIQFRLPDGRSQMKQFSPEDTLGQLYAYVKDEMTLGFSRFSLSTTFPSRQLDKESRELSLRQLGLVPSATVLILPAGGGTVHPAQAWDFSAMLWTLLMPLTALWGFVSSLLFPQQRPNGGSQAGGSASSVERKSTGAVRREGNFARLRNTDDDDDENNTYNGNSTQQM